MAHVVILANGAFPVAPRCLDLLRATCAMTAFVCCDGAYAKARAAGFEPDLVVGDGDSLDADAKARLGKRLRLIAEQDTNDLDKAFRTAVAEYGLTARDAVTILGATGLREDHAIGNVYRLVPFSETIPDATMMTDAGAFTVVRTERRYAANPGDAVSVFAPHPGTHVVSTGLAWPLAGVDLTFPWSGTLNRASADFFTLSTDRPILVYRPW